MLSLIASLALSAGQTFEAPTIDWLLATKTVMSVSLHPKEQKGLAEVYGWTDDKRTKQIFLVDLTGKAAPTLLTPDGESESAPMYSPDGSRYAFLSTKGGVSHLVVRNVATPKVLFAAKYARSIEEFTWAADGQALYVTYKQDVACTDKCLDQPPPDEAAPHISDDLLARRWDSWVERDRAVISRLDIATGEVTRLSSPDVDTPAYAFFQPRDFDASKDGKWLAWVESPASKTEAALGTDTHVVLKSLQTGEAVRVSTAKGYDRSPRFSADGAVLVWRQMQHNGYESDKNELVAYDLVKKTLRPLTTDFDYDVDEFDFSADGKAVFAHVYDQGGHAIFRLPLAGGKPERWVWAPGLVLFGASSKGLLVSPQTPLSGGAIAWISDKQKTPALLTDFNAGLTLQKPPSFEAITVKTANGPIQAWVGRPFGTKKGDKLPGVLLLHGGPQGAWTGAFSTRWNPALFVARGYLVIMPNPRGSNGFGHKFTEAISKHWPDATDDVLAVLDQEIKEGDVDPARTCAGGASYGGYLTNWIATRTDRFKCLISHAGIYNLESQYAATEEVFFGDWEFGAPWDNPDRFAAQSPHKFVKNIKTPMLVIHGEKDYRVPYTEGLQLFTALKHQGVPARLVVFPTENHWVLSAANKRVWFREMLGWLDTHLNVAAPRASATSTTQIN